MELDELIILAKGDNNKREKLISEYISFIKKSVQSVCYNYGDDEYSIGLSAFNEAITSFDESKGHFLSYARLIIKRRIIDFLRKNTNSYVANVDLFDDEQYSEDIANKDYEKFLQIERQNDIKLEMEEFEKELELFDIKFSEIVKASPKWKNSKNVCDKIIDYAMQNKLYENIKATKLFPINVITKELFISRKKIERYRKYLIARLIILNGDYYYLNEYAKCGENK